MIIFEINGKKYGLNKDELFQKLVAEKLEDLKNNDFDGKRGLFNSLIGSAMMMTGIKKQEQHKDFDNITFASVLAVSQVLEKLDGAVIPIEAEEL